MVDPKKSGSSDVGQGSDQNLGERREGASEKTGEQRGLPEHRDMGVRRDLGEGDIDNAGERLGTPTESAP